MDNKQYSTIKKSKKKKCITFASEEGNLRLAMITVVTYRTREPQQCPIPMVLRKIPKTQYILVSLFKLQSRVIDALFHNGVILECALTAKLTQKNICLAINDLLNGRKY